jgi:hypothetical protein
LGASSASGKIVLVFVSKDKSGVSRANINDKTDPGFG